MKNILFIEPFFGGSHEEFARGLVQHSSHRIDLVTLPARNWTWRINGAAFHFARSDIPFERYDAVITTSMLRLCDLKSLLGNRLPPVLVYFHENQISYPLAPGEKRDPALCCADIGTLLTADRILFNSRFHQEEFFKSLRDFHGRSPDYPIDIPMDDILIKTDVLYPGMTFADPIPPRCDAPQKIPLIIWNHRWSFDKNAPSLFYALDRIVEMGIDFQIAFLGENSGRIPETFQSARKRLGHRIVRFGYEPNRDDYLQWLMNGDVSVSTSVQENFGMSVVESARYGCIPILPNRLSYPEIIPTEFHSDLLYKNQREFIEKLSRILRNTREYERLRSRLSLHMGDFSWPHVIGQYDRVIESLCSSRQ